MSSRLFVKIIHNYFTVLWLTGRSFYVCQTITAGILPLRLLWRPCFLAKSAQTQGTDTTQIPAVWRQLHTALHPQEAGPGDPGLASPGDPGPGAPCSSEA